MNPCRAKSGRHDPAVMCTGPPHLGQIVTRSGEPALRTLGGPAPCRLRTALPCPIGRHPCRHPPSWPPSGGGAPRRRSVMPGGSSGTPARPARSAARRQGARHAAAQHRPRHGRGGKGGRRGRGGRRRLIDYPRYGKRGCAAGCRPGVCCSARPSRSARSGWPGWRGCTVTTRCRAPRTSPRRRPPPSTTPTAPPRWAPSAAEPGDPARGDHPQGHEGRRGRRRGPHVLLQPRDRPGGPDAGAVQRPALRDPPGRVLDHPAVRRALLLQLHGEHVLGQAQGSDPGPQARPPAGQGQDPVQLPQHHLLRTRLLRRRDRLPGVLRSERGEAHGVPGSAAGRRSSRRPTTSTPGSR